jgi:phospho-N-acetylmuramoyl-pentapeptide-transferase
MLIDLFEWLNRYSGHFPGAGLFQYITFRAGLAVIFSLVISLVFGGGIINYLRKLQIGESIRDLGLQGQIQKQGTPTMGGIIIILAILIPTLLVSRLDNIYILMMLIATIWMGIIGFIDDYIKVFKKDKQGLKGKFKIAGQIGLGLIIALMMLGSDEIVVRMDTEDALLLGLNEKADYKTTLTNIPFMKGNQLNYAALIPIKAQANKYWIWLIFIPVVIFIVTGVSNAANLTDGLDGLATGVSGIIAMTLGIFAYVSGNAIAANYLNILHLPGSGELLIFTGALLGACLGFLWYNSYPAQIFMGDTGSLTLGGIIGALAIILRKELILPVLCGVFVVESLSVIIQVAYFKYTKKKYGEGKRIFLMSPIHHHFQKKGIHEVKIVTRFWLVGVLLAVFTLITLKIR